MDKDSLNIFNSNLHTLELRDKIKKYAALKPMKGRLLDFGCGTKPYKKYFKSIDEYVGVEYAQTDYNYKGLSIEAFYDGKTIPFEDDYFDCIFTSQVLEQVRDIHKTIDEFKRVLKPGGHLLITVSFNYSEIAAKNDFARYTLKGFSALLKENGFSIQKREKICVGINNISVLVVNYLELAFQEHFLRKTVLPVLKTGVNLTSIFLRKIIADNDNFYTGSIILAKKR